MANTPESLAIGIDVGATKLAAALVGSNGQILATRHTPTNAQLGTSAILDQIAMQANELIKLVRSDSSLTLLGVGVGIPGQINPKNGIVREAVNLGWDEVNLYPEIQERLIMSFPIWADTDTNACTLGEFYFGTARSCQNFVYMSIGSGLGGGIIVNGRLALGATWKAAELGHISLDTNGVPCVCGLRGCAETIVSGPGLIRLVKELLSQKKLTSRLSTEKDLTTKTIITAARDGDELALAALSEMGRSLGMVISFCAAVINPSLVVIGGGLGLAAFDMIIPSAKKEIERRILPSLHSNLIIARSQLSSSAVGAACLVFSQRNEGD